ncbi:MAG: hypothetical protein JOZ72_01575 [Alphaproteobacteria bacterium]|nr:hypothetical protein [Alphaproteobacteria bacterium]
MLLYLAGSLIGVAAIVALAGWLFGWRDAALDAERVAQALAREVPGFRAGRASPDTRAVLIEDARDGAVYLAVARGDGLVTRKLARGLGVARDGGTLTIRLRDFTLRRAHLQLADADYWEARLKGLAP